MQRAAAGLAHAVLDCSAAATAAGCCCWSAPATTAATRCTPARAAAPPRRGRRRRCCSGRATTRPGSPRCSRPGAGVVNDAVDAARPDVVVDGIVGIGGRPGLRPDAAAALAALAGVPVVAVDVPSGVDVDTGELDGPHVRADLTVTFGTHKVAHLVDPAAGACGAVHLVDIGLDLPPADVEALQPADVAALLPRPDGRTPRSTPAASSASAPARETYPGAALLCVAGASCGLAGMVRYVGRAGGRGPAAPIPRSSGEGRVQAWVVGSGGGDDAGGALGAALRRRRPGRRGRRCARPRRRAARRTRRAHAARRRAGPDARRGARGRRGPPARARPPRGRAVRRGGAAEGPAHARRRPDGRVRVTTTGLPWLATAGAGDVLAGLIGALLAAGLDPWDAASVGSWLHGAAATEASGGGPLVAGDVARALGAVLRSLL